MSLEKKPSGSQGGRGSLQSNGRNSNVSSTSHRRSILSDRACLSPDPVLPQRASVDRLAQPKTSSQELFLVARAPTLRSRKTTLTYETEKLLRNLEEAAKQRSPSRSLSRNPVEEKRSSQASVRARPSPTNAVPSRQSVPNVSARRSAAEVPFRKPSVSNAPSPSKPAASSPLPASPKPSLERPRRSLESPQKEASRRFTADENARKPPVPTAPSPSRPAAPASPKISLERPRPGFSSPKNGTPISTAQETPAQPSRVPLTNLSYSPKQASTPPLRKTSSPLPANQSLTQFYNEAEEILATLPSDEITIKPRRSTTPQDLVPGMQSPRKFSSSDSAHCATCTSENCLRCTNRGTKRPASSYPEPKLRMFTGPQGDPYMRKECCEGPLNDEDSERRKYFGLIFNCLNQVRGKNYIQSPIVKRYLRKKGFLNFDCMVKVPYYEFRQWVDEMETLNKDLYHSIGKEKNLDFAFADMMGMGQGMGDSSDLSPREQYDRDGEPYAEIHEGTLVKLLQKHEWLLTLRDDFQEYVKMSHKRNMRIAEEIRRREANRQREARDATRLAAYEFRIHTAEAQRAQLLEKRFERNLQFQIQRARQQELEKHVQKLEMLDRAEARHNDFMRKQEMSKPKRLRQERYEEGMRPFRHDSRELPPNIQAVLSKLLLPNRTVSDTSEPGTVPRWTPSPTSLTRLHSMPSSPVPDRPPARLSRHHPQLQSEPELAQQPTPEWWDDEDEAENDELREAPSVLDVPSYTTDMDQEPSQVDYPHIQQESSIGQPCYLKGVDGRTNLPHCVSTFGDQSQPTTITDSTLSSPSPRPPQQRTVVTSTSDLILYNPPAPKKGRQTPTSYPSMQSGIGTQPSRAQFAHAHIQPSDLSIYHAGTQPSSPNITHAGTHHSTQDIQHMGIQPSAADVTHAHVQPSKMDIYHAGTQPSMRDVSHMGTHPSAQNIQHMGIQPSEVEFAHVDIQPSELGIYHAGTQPSSRDVTHAGTHHSTLDFSHAGIQPSLQNISHTGTHPSSQDIQHMSTQPSATEFAHAHIQPSELGLYHAGTQPSSRDVSHAGTHHSTADFSHAGIQPSVRDISHTGTHPSSLDIQHMGVQPSAAEFAHAHIQPSELGISHAGTHHSTADFSHAGIQPSMRDVSHTGTHPSSQDIQHMGVQPSAASMYHMEVQPSREHQAHIGTHHSTALVSHFGVQPSARDLGHPTRVERFLAGLKPEQIKLLHAVIQPSTEDFQTGTSHAGTGPSMRNLAHTGTHPSEMGMTHAGIQPSQRDFTHAGTHASTRDLLHAGIQPSERDFTHTGTHASTRDLTHTEVQPSQRDFAHAGTHPNTRDLSQAGVQPSERNFAHSGTHASRRDLAHAEVQPSQRDFAHTGTHASMRDLSHAEAQYSDHSLGRGKSGLDASTASIQPSILSAQHMGVQASQPQFADAYAHPSERDLSHAGVQPSFQHEYHIGTQKSVGPQGHVGTHHSQSHLAQTGVQPSDVDMAHAGTHPSTANMDHAGTQPSQIEPSHVSAQRSFIPQSHVSTHFGGVDTAHVGAQPSRTVTHAGTHPSQLDFSHAGVQPSTANMRHMDAQHSGYDLAHAGTQPDERTHVGTHHSGVDFQHAGAQPSYKDFGHMGTQPSAADQAHASIQPSRSHVAHAGTHRSRADMNHVGLQPSDIRSQQHMGTGPSDVSMHLSPSHQWKNVRSEQLEPVDMSHSGSLQGAQPLSMFLPHEDLDQRHVATRAELAPSRSAVMPIPSTTQIIDGRRYKLIPAGTAAAYADASTFLWTQTDRDLASLPHHASSQTQVPLDQELAFERGFAGSHPSTTSTAQSPRVSPSPRTPAVPVPPQPSIQLRSQEGPSKAALSPDVSEECGVYFTPGCRVFGDPDEIGETVDLPQPVDTKQPSEEPEELAAPGTAVSREPMVPVKAEPLSMFFPHEDLEDRDITTRADEAKVAPLQTASDVAKETTSLDRASINIMDSALRFAENVVATVRGNMSSGEGIGLRASMEKPEGTLFRELPSERSEPDLVLVRNLEQMPSKKPSEDTTLTPMKPDPLSIFFPHLGPSKSFGQVHMPPTKAPAEAVSEVEMSPVKATTDDPKEAASLDRASFNIVDSALRFAEELEEPTKPSPEFWAEAEPVEDADRPSESVPDLALVPVPQAMPGNEAEVEDIRPLDFVPTLEYIALKPAPLSAFFPPTGSVQSFGTTHMPHIYGTRDPDQTQEMHDQDLDSQHEDFLTPDLPRTLVPEAQSAHSFGRGRVPDVLSREDTGKSVPTEERSEMEADAGTTLKPAPLSAFFPQAESSKSFGKVHMAQRPEEPSLAAEDTDENTPHTLTPYASRDESSHPGVHEPVHVDASHLRLPSPGLSAASSASSVMSTKSELIEDLVKQAQPDTEPSTDLPESLVQAPTELAETEQKGEVEQSPTRQPLPSHTTIDIQPPSQTNIPFAGPFLAPSPRESSVSSVSLGGTGSDIVDDLMDYAEISLAIPVSSVRSISEPEPEFSPEGTAVEESKSEELMPELPTYGTISAASAAVSGLGETDVILHHAQNHPAALDHSASNLELAHEVSSRLDEEETPNFPTLWPVGLQQAVSAASSAVSGLGETDDIVQHAERSHEEDNRGHLQTGTSLMEMPQLHHSTSHTWNAPGDSAVEHSPSASHQSLDALISDVLQSYHSSTDDLRLGSAEEEHQSYPSLYVEGPIHPTLFPVASSVSIIPSSSTNISHIEGLAADHFHHEDEHGHLAPAPSEALIHSSSSTSLYPTSSASLSRMEARAAKGISSEYFPSPSISDVSFYSGSSIAPGSATDFSGIEMVAGQRSSILQEAPSGTSQDDVAPSAVDSQKPSKPGLLLATLSAAPSGISIQPASDENVSRIVDHAEFAHGHEPSRSDFTVATQASSDGSFADPASTDNVSHILKEAADHHTLQASASDFSTASSAESATSFVSVEPTSTDNVSHVIREAADHPTLKPSASVLSIRTPSEASSVTSVEPTSTDNVSHLVAEAAEHHTLKPSSSALSGVSPSGSSASVLSTEPVSTDNVSHLIRGAADHPVPAVSSALLTPTGNAPLILTTETTDHEKVTIIVEPASVEDVTGQEQHVASEAGLSTVSPVSSTVSSFAPTSTDNVSHMLREAAGHPALQPSRSDLSVASSSVTSIEPSSTDNVSHRVGKAADHFSLQPSASGLSVETPSGTSSVASFDPTSTDNVSHPVAQAANHHALQPSASAVSVVSPSGSTYSAISIQPASTDNVSHMIREAADHPALQPSESVLSVKMPSEASSVTSVEPASTDNISHMLREAADHSTLTASNTSIVSVASRTGAPPVAEDVDSEKVTLPPDQSQLKPAVYKPVSNVSSVVIVEPSSIDNIEQEAADQLKSSGTNFLSAAPSGASVPSSASSASISPSDTNISHMVAEAADAVQSLEHTLHPPGPHHTASKSELLSAAPSGTSVWSTASSASVDPSSGTNISHMVAEAADAVHSLEDTLHPPTATGAASNSGLLSATPSGTSEASSASFIDTKSAADISHMEETAAEATRAIDEVHPLDPASSLRLWNLALSTPSSEAPFDPSTSRDTSANVSQPQQTHERQHPVAVEPSKPEFLSASPSAASVYSSSPGSEISVSQFEVTGPSDENIPATLHAVANTDHLKMTPSSASSGSSVYSSSDTDISHMEASALEGVQSVQLPEGNAVPETSSAYSVQSSISPGSDSNISHMETLGGFHSEHSDVQHGLAPPTQLVPPTKSGLLSAASSASSVASSNYPGSDANISHMESAAARSGHSQETEDAAGTPDQKPFAIPSETQLLSAESSAASLPSATSEKSAFSAVQEPKPNAVANDRITEVQHTPENLTVPGNLLQPSTLSLLSATSSVSSLHSSAYLGSDANISHMDNQAAHTEESAEGQETLRPGFRPQPTLSQLLSAMPSVASGISQQSSDYPGSTENISHMENLAAEDARSEEPMPTSSRTDTLPTVSTSVTESTNDYSAEEKSGIEAAEGLSGHSFSEAVRARSLRPPTQTGPNTSPLSSASEHSLQSTSSVSLFPNSSASASRFESTAAGALEADSLLSDQGRASVSESPSRSAVSSSPITGMRSGVSTADSPPGQEAKEPLSAIIEKHDSDRVRKNSESVKEEFMAPKLVKETSSVLVRNKPRHDSHEDVRLAASGAPSVHMYIPPSKSEDEAYKDTDLQALDDSYKGGFEHTPSEDARSILERAPPSMEMVSSTYGSATPSSAPSRRTSPSKPNEELVPDDPKQEVPAVVVDEESALSSDERSSEPGSSTGSSVYSSPSQHSTHTPPTTLSATSVVSKASSQRAGGSPSAISSANISRMESRAADLAPSSSHSTGTSGTSAVSGVSSVNIDRMEEKGAAILGPSSGSETGAKKIEEKPAEKPAVVIEITPAESKGETVAVTVHAHGKDAALLAPAGKASRHHSPKSSPSESELSTSSVSTNASSPGVSYSATRATDKEKGFESDVSDGSQYSSPGSQASSSNSKTGRTSEATHATAGSPPEKNTEPKVKVTVGPDETTVLVEPTAEESVIISIQDVHTSPMNVHVRTSAGGKTEVKLGTVPSSSTPTDDSPQTSGGSSSSRTDLSETASASENGDQPVQQPQKPES